MYKQAHSPLKVSDKSPSNKKSMMMSMKRRSASGYLEKKNLQQRSSSGENQVVLRE